MQKKRKVLMALVAVSVTGAFFQNCAREILKPTLMPLPAKGASNPIRFVRLNGLDAKGECSFGADGGQAQSLGPIECTKACEIVKKTNPKAVCSFQGQQLSNVQECQVRAMNGDSLAASLASTAGDCFGVCKATAGAPGTSCEWGKFKVIFNLQEEPKPVMVRMPTGLMSPAKNQKTKSKRL